MKYNANIAKELEKKHSLSYSTAYRWRKGSSIPDMYLNNGQRLIQGMTLREAKNFTKLSLRQIQALLFLESGDEKIIYNIVSISYWFSGKRNPRKQWIWDILDRKVTENKKLK